MLIPERFVLAMQENNWIVRNSIIWHKINSLPENVKDRFSNCFENVYMFTKNKNYWFNVQYEKSKAKDYKNKKELDDYKTLYRQKRNIISINLEPSKSGHIAPFPKKLVYPLIKSGCPKYICSQCREPYKVIIKKENDKIKKLYKKNCKCLTNDKDRGITLDMFTGSGTTQLVCLEQNKDYLGIELNKEYYDYAVNRIEKFKLVIKENNNRLF
jgi:site-specific DNA-methyltransferase (adenine-specific)